LNDEPFDDERGIFASRSWSIVERLSTSQTQAGARVMAADSGSSGIR
jgi:hypothetical protein